MVDLNNLNMNTAMKPEREKRNGVTRPEEGTRTGLVWDIADEVTNRRRTAGHTHTVALLDEVRKHYMTVDGAQISTCQTQYNRWVVFNGLQAEVKARRDEEKLAANTAASAAKAAEAAAKAEAKTKREAEKAERVAAREAKAAEAAAKKAAREEKKANADQIKAQKEAEKASKAAAKLAEQTAKAQERAKKEAEKLAKKQEELEAKQAELAKNAAAVAAAAAAVQVAPASTTQSVGAEDELARLAREAVEAANAG